MKTTLRIQKKEPLGKWETVEYIEGRFEDATQACYALLSPAVSEFGQGTASEARFATGLWGTDWTYLPTLEEWLR